jgi:hypothetical protein
LAVAASTGLAFAEPLEASGVAESFWILFAEKSILTWPVKRPESWCVKARFWKHNFQSNKRFVEEKMSM